MKVRTRVIDELLSPLRQYILKDNLSRENVDARPPLRSDLFSADQMAQHADQLAASHQISTLWTPEKLLSRLADNEEMLFRVTELLREAAHEKKPVSPAGEWLLDNFYLIEEEIQTGRRYLPKGYSKALPHLGSGRMKGYPRVYEVAIEIISHSDGRVDIDTLGNFVHAYQKISQLTIGELWAIPIMLRLALLENLSRVAARIAIDRLDSGLAHYWAKKIIEVTETKPKNLVLIIADMARSNPPMVSAFVAEFARKLQWRGVDLTMPLTWLEQHASDAGFTIGSMVQAENQKQASDQVSVSNSIHSLRLLSKMDWREFVEKVSIIEQTLSESDSTYAKMDFYTRDRYRHSVEQIAKESKLSEEEVAKIAIRLSKDSAQREPANANKSHVGYYLIDKGVDITKKEVGISASLRQFFAKHRRKFLYTGYVAGAFSIVALGSFALISRAISDEPVTWVLACVAVLSLLITSHLALALVNWLSTLLVKPVPLPRMDFSKGIPGSCKTLVVVPSILSNPSQVEKLVEDLEVRYLANRERNLFFGLATDFNDSDSEHMPDDDTLVALAQSRIQELNVRYGDRQGFMLFHRPRRYNQSERKWIGYERKRGKLGELNKLLRGEGRDRFSVVIGDDEVFKEIRYIITLDTDTQLPREAAWKLIGVMAHPLNAPVYSEKKNRVVAGYSIIQPRIAISLHGILRTRYMRMNENDAGIDPYTRVTSDIYQDVFEEGSFIGKGIYDIDSFEKILNNRFPENRILSHDLLEGVYARCAFASDIQLYEEYPSRYDADISRRHRWMRGDWQIASWCLPWAVSGNGQVRRNRLSALSRWKIFDNLRRSILPIGFALFFVLAWVSLSNPLFWILCLTGIIFLPAFLSSLWSAVNKPNEVNFGQHLKNTIGATHKNILQTIFSLIALPYESLISLDAIVRTLWRIHISRRHLMEWNPSSFSKRKRANLLTLFRKMWFAPVFSVGVFLFLVNRHPFSLYVAVPFLFFWILSPAIVSWLDLPVTSRKSKLNDSQRLQLRLLARKTWAFFETLVGPEDNWLPPDNIQQYPIPVIAHRTSPTNLGLALLANLSAHDFGYITTEQLLNRTEHALRSMEKLERHAGHFFNWYDTVTLKTLNPRYISTVDSGNLAAHLLTFRQGLLSVSRKKIIGRCYLEGLYDSLTLASKDASIDNQALVKQMMRDIDVKFSRSLSLTEFYNFVQSAATLFRNRNKSTMAETEEWLRWSELLQQQFDSLVASIEQATPWVKFLPSEKHLDLEFLDHIPTVLELATLDKKLLPILTQLKEAAEPQPTWLTELEQSIEGSSTYARRLIQQADSLANLCFDFADMEYDFLYDKSKRLISIGYSTEEHRSDNVYYDLLASEARLASFVAIAQGKIPQENWFALGRRLVTFGKNSMLLSWSGSMFEYLMPPLVMPSYENTLLDETYHGTVQAQIDYGRLHGVPWGISESGYNVVDRSLIYQYKAFGVPGLGFKRGLGQDLVIAPYATVLALMVDPVPAYKNLDRLKADGYEGKYGFYEAVDFTPSRLSRGQSLALIQSFMVHHQGMSLLSLAYVLLDRPMQKRFEADPQFQTALLLLQEQVPKNVAHYSTSTDRETERPAYSGEEIRIITTPDTTIPEVHLLSNGKYHVMVTNAGGGYSRWKGLAVTRWREDTTCDNWGSFCYIRDLSRDEIWSTTFQPTLKQSPVYESIFSPGRAEFRRKDFDIESHTEIVVSPEDDVEVRRIHLTNHSDKTKVVEVTSYTEVVLAFPEADISHPAFSNLFVQTEINSTQHAIFCTRRPRSKEEHPPWMFHVMKATGGDDYVVTYETDRARFLGRGNTLGSPKAMRSDEDLTGSQGSVLDPVAVIRYRIKINPRETIIIDLVTGVAATREENQGLTDKYQDRHLRDRAFGLSWTHNQVILRQIGSTESDTQLYGKLASSVIFNNPALRGNPAIIMKNQRGQSALWSHSISGDLPIVLLRISDSENMTLVTQLIKAQAYWHLKGLSVDLVILNEDPSSYRQLLQDQIQSLIAAGIGGIGTDRHGKIFLRPVEQVSEEDRILFQSVARVVISDTRGTLADQVNKRSQQKPTIPALVPVSYLQPSHQKQPPKEELTFFNGHGGFSRDGDEYVIISGPEHTTPMPWINVIANPGFGTIVTESGMSYTWAENAHEYRLTPWGNDPISNSSGEAFFIRDEESGTFWSPTPMPVQAESEYITRHGFGYSVFQCTHDGISTETTVHIDKEASMKFVSVRIRNLSGRSRKLSVTGYVEWVLGVDRAKSAMHVVTELDTETGAVVARNAYNSEFTSRVSFFDVDDAQHHVTADRSEFIGRNRTLKNPEAMSKTRLSGKVGAGLDPCLAIQVPFELDSGKEREIIFKMGTGKNREEVKALLKRFRGNAAAAKSLGEIRDHWKSLLTTIHVETPDASINTLANGWLLYQVISCRLWGRSGFYQSGGAFGFRDQLQDVLSLCHIQPSYARQQILLSASRQFTEGDVQHWWHPPIGRGVRTMCSDDFVWLPYVTSRYIESTGDLKILNEQVSFIQGRQLNTNEESYYDLPFVADQKASLYDHCKRSIQRALRFGPHGLPLMGSGDWNDGMNMVGIHGEGESVWLAFFLCEVLQRFIRIAEMQADDSFVKVYEDNLQQLRKNIEKNAWDGNWYMRAFFDDGTPLGSSKNSECKIDAIAQSWAVLSGAGDSKRSRIAMNEVDKFLVNRNKKLIQLLDPPFNTSDADPGYIKGYVPGVRENGGQYTHAAIWMVMAFARLREREKTFELLSMINPVNHGSSEKAISTYKVEPYVMAADVYGVAPHTGRGGWTWYTGSAGWMYQLILESFLGFKREGDKLSFEPCVPESWNSFRVTYRFGGTPYNITLIQILDEQKTGLTVDNVLQQGNTLTLKDDKVEHTVTFHFQFKMPAENVDALRLL